MIPIHTHVSAMAALNIFLAVLIVGTVWRLSSYHLVASKNQNLAHLGKAMAFQF